MRGETPTTFGKAQFITCPECDAHFAFCRSAAARIDSCGFESYSFDCKECKAKLAGIVDPKQEELLLSKLEL